MTSPASAAVDGLAGAVVTLHGEFAAGTRGDIVRVLDALGARVRNELAGDSTHLVVGEDARRLATLLGKPAVERRAEALAAAGQPLRVLSEQDLAALVACATGVEDLADAIALARVGRLAPRVAGVTASPRERASIDPLLVAVGEGPVAARIAAIEALARRGDPAVVPALVEAAADGRYEVLAAVTRALAWLGGDAAFPFLAARMADPRLVDRPLREQVARALERRGDGEALGALANAIIALAGTRGLEEAGAFGRLVARGVTRWGHDDAPLAVEFEEGRDDGRSHDVEAVAQRVGALETLVDERGVVVRRVRVASLPPLPADGALASAPPFYALVSLAAQRRGSRVWIAGVALPAELPWAVWSALALPVAGLARRG